MKTIKTLIACAIVMLLFITISNAQPDFFHKYGCHYSKNLVPIHPLTPEESYRNILNENRSDTIDILNYNITLEIIDFTGKQVNGNCKVDFVPLMNNVDHIILDLMEFNIDSITQNGQQIPFDYDGMQIIASLDQVYNTLDSTAITVFYNGVPLVDPGDFGGLDFRGGYAYNLGIALNSNPYNYGKGWFPCFDNFVERTTYDFNIITANGRKGYCSGTLIDEVTLGGDTIMRSYRMNNPLTTYLAGVAVSNYGEVNGFHQGLNGSIPTQLLAKPADTTAMKTSFETLGDAIDMLEFWFGPYCWDRVGYAHTVVGAMEHAENIAYPDFIGVSGNNLDQRNLMSHELAHHWWGNVTTLSSPADMWIKEGNAEYSAHLMTEWLNGREAFVNQVIENQRDVMRTAHNDDGDYLALSPMAFEDTYGTHTYYKGASEMHNLRGYLGDSLFRQGMTAVLVENKFSSMDANEFRDDLTAATGVDMAPFFNAHIFNPGWGVFEVDSVQVTAASSGFDVKCFMQNKLYKSPFFHEQVPIAITFFDYEGNEATRRMISDGEFSDAMTNIPFEPEFQIVNYTTTMTLAQFSSDLVLEVPNVYGFANTNFTINLVENNGDSERIWIQHLYGGPDVPDDDNSGTRFSSTHYWQVDGDFDPDIFIATGLIEYRRSGQFGLDADLTSNTEDSLILVYRADPGQPWGEFSDYSKNIISPTDGNGFIRITRLVPGQYAFANGALPVSNNNIENQIDLSFYPNPAINELTLSANLDKPLEMNAEIYSLSGKRMKDFELPENSALLKKLDLEGFPQGTYILYLKDKKGKTIATKKFEIFKP